MSNRWSSYNARNCSSCSGCQTCFDIPAAIDFFVGALNISPNSFSFRITPRRVRFRSIKLSTIQSITSTSHSIQEQRKLKDYDCSDSRKKIFLLQMPLTLLGSWIVLIFQVKLTQLLFLLFGPSFFPAIKNRVEQVPNVRIMALPTLLESLQCSPFPSHSPPESSYRKTFQQKFLDSSEQFRWIVVQHISPVFEVHRGFCGEDDR